MPWFWVDDAFADSKPVMALDRSLRNEAIGLWVRCGAWSAKEETDGRVSLDTVKSFDGTPRLIRALHEQAGLWAESSPESWRNSRQILFGNWEKWQKTKAENEARRKADAARQADYRRNKKGRGYVAKDDPSSSDSEMSRRDSDRDIAHGPDDSGKDVSRRESQRPDPDPTQTRPEPSLVETSGGGVTSADAHDPRPPKCPDHKANSDEPCRRCKAIRKWEERNVEAVQRDQLEDRRRQRIIQANCPRCEGTNTYEDERGVHPCRPHLEASNA